MTYDAIILGGGAPGEHCAGRLAEGGAKVAIVERELVAGECTYWACIPSKTLLRPGEALEAARQAPGARERVDGIVDSASAFEWRNFQVSDYSDAGQVRWMESMGIDLIRGEGHIAGPGLIGVNGELHQTRNIVIACGSDPVIPPIPGLRELDGVWTNRGATGATEVPRRLLVLGGGPVGVEMAQAFKRMGSEVAVVEGAEHLLPREPEQLGRTLGDVFSDEGIELHFGQHASAARRDGDDYVLSFPDGAELRGDKLLVATGRRARTDIGLENVGVTPEQRGVPVDARMNVTDGVWAIGDVTGIWPLTYVGKYQGRVAAANILGKPTEASYEAVPRVVFTDPQAVSVGAAEGERTVTVPLAEVPRTSTYTREYERPGFFTLISDGEYVTGAHGLGPEAGEWLGQATLAIRARVPLSILNDTIQPFPTFSEVYLNALLALGAPRPAAVA